MGAGAETELGTAANIHRHVAAERHVSSGHANGRSVLHKLEKEQCPFPGYIESPGI